MQSKVTQHMQKAQHGLARAYLALGDDEKALEHFIEAQRIDPHIPFLMENIAKFSHAKGQYANAIEYWSKVPQQDDNIIEINYNIGVSYHFMGQHDSAKTYFENVLHLEPDHIDTHINLATIALQASNPEQALRHYKYIHAQDPSREDINYLLAALEQKHYTHNPPQDYVKNLFDQYAHYYEKHLTGMLRYQVPEEISLLLAQYAQKESITLDLGCGSGVMAQHCFLFQAFNRR